MNTQNNSIRIGRSRHPRRLARWMFAGGLTIGLLLPGAAIAQSSMSGGRGATAIVRIGQPSQPDADVQSSYSMSVNEDGHEYKIEMKNGVVTLAQIDGQTVPDDRIENDGDTVRLKNEKGEVVYEHQIPTDFSWNGQGFAAVDPGTPFWQTFGGGGSPAGIGLNSLGSLGLTEPQIAMLAPEPGEAPAVMIGVQMGVPDSTLCGHLGIERDKSTLLTAVHETLPAAAAGLEPYDIIVSIDGKDGANPAMIRDALKDKKAGDTLKLGVIHKGVRKDVTITLEAYDRQKLISAKVDRIAADNNDVFAVATAPNAPLPPLPSSIPEQYRKQIEQYLKQNNFPRAYTINRFGSRAPIANQDQQRLLAEIEKQQAEAAKQADEAAQRAREMARQFRAHGLPGGQTIVVPDPNEMRQRMERMEKMLEQLMNEKLQQAKPQEPPAKDPATQS